MSESLDPIEGDGDAQRIYVPDENKAPPWVALEVDEDPPEYVSTNENGNAKFYEKGAGRKLAQAVLRESDRDVSREQIEQSNEYVVNKDGEWIREKARKGEIDAEPVIACIETIAKFVGGLEEGRKRGDDEIAEEMLEGWLDGGHVELERVYFKRDAEKITVARALDLVRDDLLRYCSPGDGRKD